MNNKFVIYGSEYSPYSVKVRSYFRYKGIPHEWRQRTLDNFAEFEALAKLPIIPLVLTPDGIVKQDSTPIIEWVEELHPAPSIYPDSLEMQFISALFEEYGDEWVNKPMFHYRWWRDVDQVAVSSGFAETLKPDGSTDEKAVLAENFRQRMVQRLHFVGSSEQNKELIETSFKNLIDLLEEHLKNRGYLFGECPSFGDFGLFSQLYGCQQQPTTKKMLDRKPSVCRWINRMLDPKKEGGWEAWSSLANSLQPILRSQIGGLYLPWAAANARALIKREKAFTVTLNDTGFKQNSMKYSGRTFHALQTRFRAVTQRDKLEEILISSDCFRPLVTEVW